MLKFAKKHPILAFVLMYLIINFISGVFDLVKRTLFFTDSNIILKNPIVEIYSLIFYVVIYLCVIYAFRFNYIYKINKENFKKTFKFIYVFVLFYLTWLLIILISNISSKTEFKHPIEILLSFLYVFFISFTEETMFRGILTSFLALKYGETKKGIFITVFASGIIFGLAHILNFLVGINYLFVFFQVIYATSIGSFFSTIYLRGGFSLWPLVMLHCVINLVGMFNFWFVKGFDDVRTILNKPITNTAICSYMVVTIIGFLCTVFLLRKNKINEAIENVKILNEKI